MRHQLRRAAEIYSRGGIYEFISRFYQSLTRRITTPLYREYVDRLLDGVRIIERSELIEKAQSQENIWRYGRGETIEIDDVDDELLPSEFADRTGRYRTLRAFVCEIGRSKILLPGGVVRTADGLVSETAETSWKILRDRLVFRCRYEGVVATAADVRNGPDASDAPDITSPAFLMHWHPTVNYYHWIIEYLGKIRALERYREATGTSPSVLVNPEAPQWVQESMLLMGFDPEEYVCPDSPRIHAERVVVPSHRVRNGDTYLLSRDECRFIRERALENLPEFESRIDVSSSSHIFISREDAAERRLLNRDELVHALEEEGFERYVLSELTVPEQVYLFSEAEVVVAPHGAGLANIVFGENLSVVEIFPADDIRDVYFYLSKVLDFEYDWILAEASGKDMSAPVSNVVEAVRYLGTKS